MKNVLYIGTVLLLLMVLADKSYCLDIMNLRDQSTLRCPRGIVARGDSAAGGSHGLQLIDIRKPGSMSIVGAYHTPGETRSVYGLTSRVYVAGLGFGLGVFDVIDRSRLNANGHFLVDIDR